MCHWGHNQIEKFEKWQENLRANNKTAYWIFLIVKWLAGSFATWWILHIFDKIQLGWAVKILAFIIACTVLILCFRSDYKKSGNRALFSWWIILLLLVCFSIKNLEHLSKSSPDKETETRPANKPIFELYLNREYITNNAIYKLDQDRKLFFQVFNVGTETATNFLFSFFAPFDQTNFIFPLNWQLVRYAEPIPINHKMYDMAGSFMMQEPSTDPIHGPTGSLNNGFDVTSFNISSTLQPTSSPLKKMQQFGMMLDSTIPEPTGSFIPIGITIGSDTETNSCFILLEP